MNFRLDSCDSGFDCTFENTTREQATEATVSFLVETGHAERDGRSDEEILEASGWTLREVEA